MEEVRIKKIRQAIFLAVVIILIFSFFSSVLQKWLAPRELTFGATFSHLYAEELGLDWQEVYLAMLDDLKIEKLRIPIYWSDVEKIANQRDYASLDWMMDEAAIRGVEVTLAVGVKMPRWPECYIPDWVETSQEYKIEHALADFMKETVLRYKNHPALIRWQVENEAFFPFGICARPDPKRIFDEVALVRLLDPDHPVQMTASGEQSFWVFTARPADVLGVSLYRLAWNPVIGFTPLLMPEIGYAVQRQVASLFADKVIISELQAEPWFPTIWDRQDISQLDKFYVLFSAQDLVTNVAIARRTGVDEVYFWGVEWWYYLSEKGDDRLWQMGKTIINTN